MDCSQKDKRSSLLDATNWTRRTSHVVVMWSAWVVGEREVQNSYALFLPYYHTFSLNSDVDSTASIVYAICGLGVITSASSITPPSSWLPHLCLPPPLPFLPPPPATTACVTMATVDVEEAREVQSKSVDVE